MSTFNHCAAQILHYGHNGVFSRAGLKKTFGGQLCTCKENHKHFLLLISRLLFCHMCSLTTTKCIQIYCHLLSFIGD